MAKDNCRNNEKANESISKYKLLSAYGGPGSIIHTQYGSIIVSCIEDWGFLKKIIDIENEAIQLNKSDKEINTYVVEQSKLEKNGNIGFSNDKRLLDILINRKDLINLRYLVLFPNIDITAYNDKVKNNKTFLTISSSFMPKVFFDKSNIYKQYKDWYKDWIKVNNDTYGTQFFPPKKKSNELLLQDNIVLICDYGHISDFPWSKFLRWRIDNPFGIEQKQIVDLFNYKNCCGSDDNPISKIKITSSSANASGFDGKWLKCENCGLQTSLKGIMSVKIKCPGHKPWEAKMNNDDYPYSGNQNSRNSNPPTESCESKKTMKVALTTGNNLYFSRTTSSIYMPDELFEDSIIIDIKKLSLELEIAKDNCYFNKCIEINTKIQDLKSSLSNNKADDILDSEKEVLLKFQEFRAFTIKTIHEINSQPQYLKVSDVTQNIKTEKADFSRYFSKILRIDNMKITSAQLDFSRVEPADADTDKEVLRNIFRSNANQVLAYPVVENFGEGIFFSFNNTTINEFEKEQFGFIKDWNDKLDKILSDEFSKKAVESGKTYGWQLYLVHTLAHLIMRELEFRCGYPTASLSERIYVSNDEKYKMYGFMIYTAEGAEGSMGGLIAQTRSENLVSLIGNSLKRATICHSDPLCWESEGQGLFDLNFAACFSCNLVSETSCELRNIYLDRRLLIDENSGFFVDILNRN